MKPEVAINSQIDNANNVKYSLEMTILRDICISSKILYDPNDFDSLVEEDRGILEIYKEFETFNKCMANNDQSKWILRIELDKMAMMDRNISTDDVYNSTKELYNDTINCIYSDDNAANLIFRIRICSDNSDSKNSLGQFDDDDVSILKALEKNLMDKIFSNLGRY